MKIEGVIRITLADDDEPDVVEVELHAGQLTAADFDRDDARRLDEDIAIVSDRFVTSVAESAAMLAERLGATRARATIEERSCEGRP